MSSFKKYHLNPTGYETFIYYDEVVSNQTYYIQFTYSGYQEHKDLTSETFQTNVFEHQTDDSKIDSYQASQQLDRNLTLFSLNSPVPHYILDVLKFHIKSILKMYPVELTL